MSRLTDVSMLLVLVFALVVVSTSASYADQEWFNPPDASGRPSSIVKPSSSHREAEIAHVCFTSTQSTNCHLYQSLDSSGKPASVIANGQVSNLNNGFYTEFTLAGCPAKPAPDHDTFLPDNLEIGKCDFEFDTFSQYTEESPGETGTQVLGSFTTTCKLNHRADSSAEPLGEDMVITASGRLYKIFNAIIAAPLQVEHLPAGYIELDSQCIQAFASLPPFRKARKTTNGLKHGDTATKTPNTGAKPQAYGDSAIKTPKTVAKPASSDPAGYYSQYEADDGGPYYPGETIIARGYAQVVSLTRNVAYNVGELQYVVWSEIDCSATKPYYDCLPGDTVTPKRGDFVARPYTWTIKLRKNSAYY